VLINRDYPGLRADTVLADGQEGSRRAVSHLLKSGCRRVGIITGPAQHVSSQLRLAGYKHALLEHGIPVEPELIREGRFDTASDSAAGYEQAKWLLNLAQRPDGIFACNAAMSVAALRAIFDRGLDCPEDIALAGFDDMTWFGLIRPRITAVAQPAYELGSTAAQMVLDRIAGRVTSSPTRKILNTELVVRESSKWRRREGDKNEASK
jgi:LacI family transcriptional regulator